MRIFLLEATAFVALIMASAHGAHSQQGPQGNCALHDALVRTLEEGFGENRRFIGLDQEMHVIEVFASDTTRTWTITRTKPGEMTCVVSSGAFFEVTGDPKTVPGKGL